VAIHSRDGRGVRLAFMAACAVALLAALPAAAANRVALVIGNNAYENVPQLQKAMNDADAIAAELSKLGFDVVKAENVGRRAMSRALVELEGKIQAGDTALVYFAGHGFAIDGTNYLLPVDVPAANPGEEGLVEDASFAANGLSDRLQQKGAATVILILDACRDNPFAMQGKRSIGLTRGLTRMDPAEGMFVLFSAGQGQSALDRLSDTDANPNSVFTRTLLVEMETPGQSMVQIAKKTQSKVRELAAKVDHLQVPAYYDQIVGDLYLSPDGAVVAKGSVNQLQEGGGESVLPPQEQKVAALPTAPQPLTSFMRSNAGWTVNVSLPEPATQFGYRIGDQGAFTDAGFVEALDQRTGQRMPKTHFELPPDQGKTKLYFTWRDKRGEQADVVTINFDPQAALAESEKKILEELWTAWIDFRDWNGAMLVYFSHLVTYRCAIQEVHYGYNGGPVDQVYKLPPCNILDPNSLPEDAKIDMKIPPKTKSMQVQLTYLDGTQSPLRTFNAPK
jgi:Caspase domain